MDTEVEQREFLSFLFTDIEGSTQRWERFPNDMHDVVARHDDLLSNAVERSGGVLVTHTGDGLIASFTDAAAAIAAAIEVQVAIGSNDWSVVDGLAVRVAVHRGEIVRRDGQPWGWALNLASRLNSLAHGGQIIVSGPVLDSVGDLADAPFTARPLGRHRLRDIAEPADVFQIDWPGSAHSFAPLRNAVRVRPLPAPAKNVIGRNDDIRRTRAAARTHRVLTLAGPKGSGTSTLGLELARSLADDFDGNVHRCDLLGVPASSALESIATTLGVNVRPGQSIAESISSWVDQQHVLLVLDHCALCVEAIVRLVDLLVRTSPNCTILCSSTGPLGIEGEFLHRLLPLSMDAAVELFRERAEAAGAHVSDTAELRTLCERLDRMPLALEVAASNAAIATVPELLELLAASQLQDSSGDGASIQSIRDAVDVALDELDPEQRETLLASTVFAGPFDRSAFHRVCCPHASEVESNRLLSRLLDRSLLTVDDSTGQPLFRCFESVVEALRDELDRSVLQHVRERFVHAMIDFADSSAVQLRGADERLATRRVQSQFRNLRAAVDHALSTGDLESAARISTALWDFGFMRMSDEYFRWSERVLATFATGDEALLGPVLGVAALGAWVRNDIESALEWSRRALRLEAEKGLAFDLPARLALINASVYSGLASAPPEVFREAADHQRSRPDKYFHVNVDTQNAVMAMWRGDREAAVRRAVRAVRIARESENPSSLSFALWGLGSALDADDHIQALGLLGEALGVARSVGNQWLIAISQMSLASVRRRIGDPLDAAAILLDLIDLLWRSGHRSHLWATLRLTALTLADLGDHETAVRLHACVSGAGSVMPAIPADATEWEQMLEVVGADRGHEWVAKATFITATWTTKSCVDAARVSLQAQLAQG